MIAQRPRFSFWLLPAVLGMVLAAGCMKAPDPASVSGSGASDSSAGQAAPEADPEISANAPADWVETKPQHSFYLNTWELPGDGIANISYFGNNTKTIQDNLTRWVHQFAKADGSPIEQAEQFSLDDAPMETTMIFVEGTLQSTAQIGGGDPRQDWMLIGAVVMAPHGPLYVKVLGPKESLHPQIGLVQEMLREMKVR